MSAATLWRTYESLLNQPTNLFEWILVDDASPDGGLTKSIIEKIKDEAPFVVKTLFLEKNHFGSKSVYSGCLIAEGIYVAILDHDDQLTPEALTTAKNYLDKYGEDQNVAGVCGRCINEKGLLIGGKFTLDCKLTNEADIRFIQKNTSELFQFSKIEIIKPLFELMRPGYTNGFVWAKVSQNYNYIYVNDVFRIYDTALVTSYSNTKNYLTKYPEAKAEAIKATILIYRKYFKYNFLYGLRYVASYLRHTINSGSDFSKSISDFDFFLKVCCFFIYPISKLKSKQWI